MGDSIGRLFVVSSFGESHGKCVGALIEGCPAGLSLTPDYIQKELAKRQPKSAGSTARREPDKVEILSGISEGFTTGAPLCLLVRNEDVDDTAYEKFRFLPRPSHADYPAFMKYGGFNDWRGGGRFSGRITAGFVMAGAVAKKLLERTRVEVLAHTMEIGGIKAKPVSYDDVRKKVYTDLLRCADPAASKRMEELIKKTKESGDSLGGVVEGVALNVPAGLGEPVFDTLDGRLAKAMFAIPAVKGVEFGAGFAAARLKGSENNDPFVIKDGKVVAATNNAGGVLGGISSGMPLTVRVAIKPVPSITIEQDTVDMQKMKNAKIKVVGRHDACIVPRAVVVVEAMMAVTLCDFALMAGLITRMLK